MDITKLQPFMISKKNVQYYRKQMFRGQLDSRIENKINNKIKRENRTFFKQDTKLIKEVNVKNIINVNDQEHPLLWVLYICLNGIEKYEGIKDNCYFKTETEYRYKIIDELNANSSDMKTLCKIHKIKFSHLIQILGNDGDIDLTVFKGLCLHYKINANLYFKCFKETIYTNDTKPINEIILEKNKYKINYILETQQVNKGDVVVDLIEVSNIEKPVKSMGGYKLGDLQDIAIKLGLDIKKGNKNKKKCEIYQDIIEQL